MHGYPLLTHTNTHAHKYTHTPPPLALLSLSSLTHLPLPATTSLTNHACNPHPLPPLCYCTWLRLHFLTKHACNPPPILSLPPLACNPPPQVLEHEDEMLPCSGNSGGAAKVDTSSRRAALLEGAMTSTISHTHVVQTYDYRVVHLDPTSSLNGITRSRVLHETHIIMEFCDRGSLQVRPPACVCVRERARSCVLKSEKESKPM